MEPITREEIYLAKAAGQDVASPEPVTRTEMFLKKIAERGGVTSWNDLTDRPFWKETQKTTLFPAEMYPLTVTTAYEEEIGYFAAFGVDVFAVNDVVHYVVFDGVEYECEPYYDDFIDDVVIGARDFVNYPFCIFNGVVITKTAGEHTIEQYIGKEIIHGEYLPYLTIYTKKTADRTPYIKLEDVEKIKVAYKNGIPIRIDSNLGSLGIDMQVISITGSFITAVSVAGITRGATEQVIYKFLLEDGTLHSSSRYNLGSVEENGIFYPVMYISGVYYKITVADDGTLKATEFTG